MVAPLLQARTSQARNYPGQKVDHLASSVWARRDLDGFRFEADALRLEIFIGSFEIIDHEAQVRSTRAIRGCVRWLARVIQIFDELQRVGTIRPNAKRGYAQLNSLVPGLLRNVSFLYTRPASDQSHP